MDTTLRDGEQTPDVAYTPAEKLQLAKLLLLEVGVDRIEIASTRVSEGERFAGRAFVHKLVARYHGGNIEQLFQQLEAQFGPEPSSASLRAMICQSPVMPGRTCTLSSRDCLVNLSK